MQASWLAKMGEQGRIIRVEEPESAWIEELIDAHLPHGDRTVAHKDRHLVILALDQDKRILSGDNRAREKFARIATYHDELSKLHWVDPESEGVREWLLNRAPRNEIWLLGK